ncbi:MAG: Crp/Fnr family transcriptional regulator [Syntrophobacteraceae bacterium]
MENIVQQEELIQKYLDEDNRPAAVKLLFELVAACAKEKNFKAAEALRERIFEVDPMALSEIIRSGEIIEEEKNQAIDKDHRITWSKLYNNLNVEEANALYFALNHATYEMDEVIHRQGERKPRLFFLNSGRAKIIYFQNDREVFLKSVEPGQTTGEDAFFSYTVCTTTLIALTKTEVSYLDADQLKMWKTTLPVLESKLLDFVSGTEKITELLKARELDRRNLKRISAGGRGMVHLMSRSGNPAGKPFRVDLCDISRGGMCFFVRITRKETASLLLGQRLCVAYLNPGMDPSKTINQQGIIVAVRFHPFEDCTINVKFDNPLSEELIDDLERLPQLSTEYD